MDMPPLKAVQYFCIAAQCLSFKQAAERLSVTPGAISQQIRTLEAWLGVQLFERGTRSIALTALGNSYFKRISPMMQELVGVTHSMKQLSRVRTVKLALPPAFGVRWFSPRLPGLLAAQPELDLRTHASSLPVKLGRDSFELAIRYLVAPDPKLECVPLQKLWLTPVCSPDYQQRMQSEPAQRHTLIHDILHPDWHLFYDLLQIDPRQCRTLHFDQCLMALDAIEQGLGIALCDQLLVADALAAGKLVRLLDQPQPAQRRLYLVHSRETPLSRPAAELKQWLLAQFAETDELAI
ncbi:LysR substrate-binding domain-containing protein [Marinobacterium arenosum]|uniref:LysR substrate-binding domain-containing protein n=1 Tax=Marinobacterium arenosum TaxID=2862496 RepID=UPI001C95A858|nr:LysR substrate-binding domain-containing protein [Marinobacterium arenosum]MBY4677008.1 LysR family transcriptional regulator [Marinobacterium arenosum]